MSASNGKRTTTRQDFLRKFVDRAGVKYEQAAQIYNAMVEVFADAVVTGQSVGIGRVMTIKAVRRRARPVNMGFHGQKKTIYLGDRLRFKAVVHRSFLNRRAIDWPL